MTIDQAINLLVTITLVGMMVAIGLSVTFGDLVDVARNWRLLARATLANYVLIPAVTLSLLVLFDVKPFVAAGFLILAACPGAPYGPPLTAVAKGNVPIAVGLMVLLAGSSAIVAPVLLRFLLPWVSRDAKLQVEASTIAATLLLTQLLPLGAGVSLRQLRPHLAARLQTPASVISKFLNLAAVGLILITQYPLLKELQPRGFLGMLLLLAASGLTGWLLGGRNAATCRSLTVTTSLRNIAVGLVVASGSFANTPALTAVVSYGLVSLLGTFALSLELGYLGRHEFLDPAVTAPDKARFDTPVDYDERYSK